MTNPLPAFLRPGKGGKEHYIEKYIAPGEVFYQCEVCDYRLGFHIAYQVASPVKCLICPNCGQWYVLQEQPGWADKGSEQP